MSWSEDGRWKKRRGIPVDRRRLVFLFGYRNLTVPSKDPSVDGVIVELVWPIKFRHVRSQFSTVSFGGKNKDYRFSLSSFLFSLLSFYWRTELSTSEVNNNDNHIKTSNKQQGNNFFSFLSFHLHSLFFCFKFTNLFFFLFAFVSFFWLSNKHITIITLIEPRTEQKKDHIFNSEHHFFFPNKKTKITDVSSANNNDTNKIV